MPRRPHPPSGAAAAVLALARELLAVPGATERTVHDRMLAHGSPPVRLLRDVV